MFLPRDPGLNGDYETAHRVISLPGSVASVAPVVVTRPGRGQPTRVVATSLLAASAVPVLLLWVAGLSPWVALAAGAPILALLVVPARARVLSNRSEQYLHLDHATAKDTDRGRVRRLHLERRTGGLTWFLKRTSDLLIAPLLVVVSSPLWLIVALAIKIESRGPVLFSQWRVGQHGRLFRMHKFRSMVEDAEIRIDEVAHRNESDGPLFKVSDDPRVTKVGRVIRRLSLDELPQLLNVILGDMSLVGPRPALIHEVAQFPRWVLQRLEVRPGLTGLWQVSGRFLLPFDEAARLDVFYAQNWSFAMDFRILAKTVPVVLSGKGAR
jgi:lipopolysaccharide/colanic/teichoic acid biosynthesis glycosyltransferase